MGWLARRRERRDRETAERIARLMVPAAATKSEALDALSVLTELGKMRLESEKLQLENDIARLKATEEDRREQRKYDQELKLKARERKQQQSESMKALRIRRGQKLGGDLPVQISMCEECRAKLANRQPAHTMHMEAHFKNNHDAWL